MERDDGRRRGLRREEMAVVLAAVATAVVLIQRFVEEHRLMLLPGNAAAALHSSMQTTAMALAKLQMLFGKRKEEQVKPIPSRFGVDNHVDQCVWFKALVASRDTEQWRANFRMSKVTFFKLLETLGPVLQRQDGNVKDTIPVETKLGAALYRLAHGATFKVVARKFGMGTSSCCKAFYDVCKGLEKRLGHLFDFADSQEPFDSGVGGGFTLMAMPNCCGVIGCTNFAVDGSSGDVGAEYLDLTRNYSVVMQAVVDSRSRFLDISVGPGCIPPPAILLKSRFFSRVQSTRELLSGPPLDLGTGFPVPQYVLGDGAYPLYPWLITPYLDDSRHQVQALFNKAHAEAMRPLRRAFGMLKEQWQLLKSRQRVDNIELLPIIVAASCVLQNFLIDNCEPGPQVEETEFESGVHAAHLDDVYGQGVRNSLATFIGQCHSGMQ